MSSDPSDECKAAPDAIDALADGELLVLDAEIESMRIVRCDALIGITGAAIV